MTPYRFRVYLSAPNAEDEQEFLAAARGSAALHHPWVAPPRDPEQYAGYLERIRVVRTIPFLVRLQVDSRLVGVVNVNEPVMGALRGAYLGFYVFAGAERQGLMTEGLAHVLNKAFDELGFHRLEANVQPGNAASTGLVARLGFRKEGFSPRYLLVDRDWRDHDRWAMLSDEWPAQRERLFASG